MSFTPQPSGVFQPNKYPVSPGSKYQYYGEQQGWIYDPYTDTYNRDPNAAKDYYQQTGLADPDPKPPSLGQQLLPVAATAGALYGGKELASSIVDKGVGQTFSDLGQGISEGVDKVTGIFSSGPSPSPTGAGFMSSSTQATQPVGTAIDGGTMMSDGSTFQGSMDPGAMETSWAAANPYIAGPVGAAGVVLGAKGTYDAYESGDPISGGISAAGMGLGANMLAGSLGYGALLGPWGIAGMAAIGIGAGLLGGKRDSTAEYQRKRWAEVAKDNPLWGGVYQESQQAKANNKDWGTWTANEDPTGKYVGQGWSYNAMKDIAKETGNYDGYMLALGNAQAFGDKWHKISLEKRREFIKNAVDSGLYESHRGAIKFTDDNAAKELMNQIAGGDINKMDNQQLGSLKANQAPATPDQTNTRAGFMAQERSSTLSPGIGKDGKPIQYNNRRGMM